PGLPPPARPHDHRGRQRVLLVPDHESAATARRLPRRPAGGVRQAAREQPAHARHRGRALGGGDDARHHRRQPRLREDRVPEAGVPRRHALRGDRGGRQARVEIAPPVGDRHVRAPRAEPTRGARHADPPRRGAAGVREVAQGLDRLEERDGIPNGATRLLLIATETAAGLLNIAELAAASPRIAAISWGIEDLGASMGLPRTRDAGGRYLDIPRYARMMCAIAASAAGVEALDTVYTDIDDLDGLRRECEEAAGMGFAGKLSVHPAQIDVINAAFAPTREAVAAARELIAAFEEHERLGVYAFRFRGRMVDAPHLSQARKVVARGDRAGH